MTKAGTLGQGRRGWEVERWADAALDCGVVGVSQIVCEAARTGDWHVRAKERK